MKLKSFCTTKNGKKQNGRKIFASYTSDKALITRTYRELKKLNSEINEPIKSWQLN
jgi:hypothetical protein